MGKDNDSGHGWADHVGESGDILGTAASVAQGADAGGVRLGGTGSLSRTMYEVDELGNMGEAVLVPHPAAAPALNGIGALTGAFGAITGGLDMTDDTKSTADRVVGGGNFLSGLIGTVGSIAGFGGNTVSPFLQGLASAGGTAGLAGDAFAATTWGVGATTGGAAVGTAAATGASVLGAGLAGYGLGKYADDHTKDTGWFKDAQGNNQSMTDETADAGVMMDEAFERRIGGEPGTFRHGLGDVMGDIAGVTTVAGGSVAGAMAAPVIAAHGLGSAALGGARSIWNWATGGGDK